MNAPDRFELFLLQDGEKKITETPFTAMSNTSDFLFKKEDHTLGNIITEYLKQSRNILMAGYKVAHPNVPEVLIRIQTDGSITPKEALIEACKDLVASYGHLGRQFTREHELRRMVAAGEQQQQGGAGGI